MTVLAVPGTELVGRGADDCSGWLRNARPTAPLDRAAMIVLGGSGTHEV